MVLLVGTDGNDVLYGGAGDDRLIGGLGINTLYGGVGNDILYGGPDRDFLYGEAGDDWIDPGATVLSADLVMGELVSRDPAVANIRGGLDTLISDYAVAETSFFTNGRITPANQAGVIYYSIEAFDFVDGHYTKDTGDYSAQIYRLYQSALGRTPDSAGLSYQFERYEDVLLGRPGGASLATIAADFVNAAEFTTHYGTPSDSDFVAQIYRNALGREADTAGLTYWTGQLPGIGRSGVLLGLSESQESIDRSSATIKAGLWVTDPDAAQIYRLYDTTLGRKADAGGLDYWDSLLEAGSASLRDVASAFTTSAEFLGQYGSLSDRAFVAAIYANTLHHPGDAAGIDALTSQSATIGRAGVVVALSESNEHASLLAPSMTNHGFILA